MGFSEARVEWIPFLKPGSPVQPPTFMSTSLPLLSEFRVDCSAYRTGSYMFHPLFLCCPTWGFPESIVSQCHEASASGEHLSEVLQFACPAKLVFYF